ncbi:hypothetical protein [Armatimonas sp.]|uniref:hypothetical protein n=1 Tax=Armatimonas sp. TaxID=1872638 RepID=UPI0037503D00
MNWKRIVAVVGILALLNGITALGVARPWLPVTESRVENDNLTFIKRTVTITWLEFPRLKYSYFVGERTHAESPEYSTQTLMLGFLNIDRSEYKQTSPCMPISTH